MKKKPLLVYGLVLFALTGCSTMSEERAEKLIVEEYSNHLDKAVIISTVEKNNEYYIEWENKYRGTSKVSPDGEITIIEAEIE